MTMAEITMNASDRIFQLDDGGRKDAGFQGSAGDCVARSIAIASRHPYREIYDALAEGNANQRKTKRSGKSSGKRSARNGISTKRKWFKDYMRSLGFEWTPTMQIGSGCKVHLVADELPSGRLVVSVSKHIVAVIDGVVHDTHDPSRDGTRCVYGYWKLADGDKSQDSDWQDWAAREASRFNQAVVAVGDDSPV